jgi:hypothetical protein
VAPWPSAIAEFGKCLMGTSKNRFPDAESIGFKAAELCFGVEN